MVWESFRCILANSRGAAMCLLLRSGFRTWPLYHSGLIGGLLQIWLSFWKVLLSPQRNAGALTEWPSGSCSPLWLRPFSPESLSLDGRPALGRVLVVLNFFHLRMMEATVLIGTFKAAEFFLYPSPDLFLRQSCLGGLQTIPLTSCLVCALTCTVYCTVNCGTLYRQVCAFPNHLQSIEFTTGGL